ncbi:MAG: DUF2849 domain-containing protein [Rhodospirillales bacterium]
MAIIQDGTKIKGGKGAVGPQAVTANRLVDGIVVFLAEDGRWSEHARDSAVAIDKAAADGLMAAAERAVEQRIVVGPYLMEVVDGPTGPQPLKLRERIRAEGPSIRIDLGKQAEKRTTDVSL